MEKQGHHVVPISLGGENWLDNIVDLSRSEHDTVHQYLDISGKILRSFRMKTNHLALKADIGYVQELVKLQNLYFTRVPNLPVHLIEKHAIALTNLCLRQKREMGIKIHEQPHFQNPLTRFQHYLSEYHNDKIMFIKHKK